VFIVGVSAAWFFLLYDRIDGSATHAAFDLITEALNELFLIFMCWSSTESMIKMLTQKPRLVNEI
jgi:hypothetical protein